MRKITTLPYQDSINDYLSRRAYVEDLLAEHHHNVNFKHTPIKMTASEKLETETREMREKNRRATAKRRGKADREKRAR